MDEQCRIELGKLRDFRELGLRRDLAVKAVSDGIDGKALKVLLDGGCRPELAVEILR